ncbi:alpha/beta hydrolase [Smaragdicoccus niigatensis]|uniref:alpha/beta hydrolase n=1 Tax=Smaragdicoccus niigatensis TaxID=359359 RepID=UPI00037F48FD|nr:alpha/beta hydrolase [Smaragdicoccus niigatensis]
MVKDDLWPHSPSRMGVLMNVALRTVLRTPSHLVPTNRLGVALVRTMFNVVCYATHGTELPHTKIDARWSRGRTRGEWVGTPASLGQTVVYYMHGSGYVGCSTATHRGLTSEIARRLDMPLFSLDYRLAPEHRFPAAHDDALNGFLWLVEQGHRPRDIIVAGDSAGGHLSLGLCAQLRELGVDQPRAVICLSALVDPTWTLSAEREKTVRDSFMTVALASRIVGMYTRTGDPRDPRLDVASVVGPDFPPMLLQAGGRELLAADAEHYARELNAAGGHVQLEVWPGMFHVFQIGYPLLPEARAALDSIEKFVAALEAGRNSRLA